MKQKEISLNSLLIDSDHFLLTDEEIGDNHVATSIDTPMREDAFDLSDSEKIAIIESHFREIMLTLGLDLTDDSLRGTPKRVAKMYIEEIFSGLNPANEPKIALFENKYGSISKGQSLDQTRCKRCVFYPRLAQNDARNSNRTRYFFLPTFHNTRICSQIKLF